MTDNRYNRQGWTYRSWKLNNKKLYRWKCNSDRIFARKILRRHKDYAVSLLIDESGSMCSEDKNRNAAKATVLFSEVLSRVGIPFEIRAFNTSHRCYKKFHEGFTWKHRRQIEKIILESHWRWAWGTNDAFAINQASYHLNKTGEKETERILIVMTDGMPSPCCSDIPREDQLRLPRNKREYDAFDTHFEVAQAGGTATCIGVWIKAPYVVDYYPQNVYCEEVNDLPRLVLNKLKQNIRRW